MRVYIKCGSEKLQLDCKWYGSTFSLSNRPVSKKNFLSMMDSVWFFLRMTAFTIHLKELEGCGGTAS